MRKAIDLARDYAVGAVVVKGENVIAGGSTNLKHENDPTAHGEIVAIRNACDALSSRYLEGCILYSTHEPCPMCSSAAIWAKMTGIVYGATMEDAAKKGSSISSWRQIRIPCRDVLKKGTPKLELVEKFMRDECVKLFDLTK